MSQEICHRHGNKSNWFITSWRDHSPVVGYYDLSAYLGLRCCCTCRRQWWIRVHSSGSAQALICSDLRFFFGKFSFYFYEPISWADLPHHTTSYLLRATIPHILSFRMSTDFCWSRTSGDWRIAFRYFNISTMRQQLCFFILQITSSHIFLEYLYLWLCVIPWMEDFFLFQCTPWWLSLHTCGTWRDFGNVLLL